MKYVLYLLATLAILGLATLTASAASASSSPDGLDDLTADLTLHGLENDLAANCLDGMTGHTSLEGLDAELASGNPFSWLKSGVKKLVRTFAPRVVSKGYSWLESRLSRTARKLLSSPNAPVSQHIKQAWSYGSGCKGFRAGSCGMCKAVAEDAVGGTSLDQMLHNHQANARRPRCFSPF